MLPKNHIFLLSSNVLLFKFVLFQYELYKHGYKEVAGQVSNQVSFKTILSLFLVESNIFMWQQQF